MKLLKYFVALLLCCVFGAGTSHAQTSISGTTVTISTSGSYKASGNLTALTINASRVVLDLNGFIAFGTSSSGCTTTSGVAGNSCSGTPASVAAIKITGSDVIVKNGTIAQGFNQGILINGTTPRQDVTLQDLQIADFLGAAISSTTVGLRVKNVSISRCGQGIVATDEVDLSNVTSSNNNGVGIFLESGTLDHVISNYNKGDGITVSAATLDHVVAASNQNNGVTHAGVVRGAVALGNGGDGIAVSSGLSGVVEDSKAVANSGNGYTFPSTSSCYFGLTASANGGSGISGGTALAGSVASCP